MGGGGGRNLLYFHVDCCVYRSVIGIQAWRGKVRSFKLLWEGPLKSKKCSGRGVYKRTYIYCKLEQSRNERRGYRARRIIIRLCESTFRSTRPFELAR